MSFYASIGSRISE